MPTTKHRRTAQLVMAALGDIGRHEGCTVTDIKNYISREYAVPIENFKRYLVQALEKGVAFGAIIRKHNKYSLGKVMTKLLKKHRRHRSHKAKSSIEKKRKFRYFIDRGHRGRSL